MQLSGDDLPGCEHSIEFDELRHSVSEKKELKELRG
jgi:hypothetical protein